MSRVKFGFFHVEPSISEKNFRSQLERDITSVFILDGARSVGRGGALEAVQAAGKEAWLGVASLCCESRANAGIADVGDGEATFKPVTVYREGWRERLETLADNIRKSGCYDAFLGMYMDEPLLWNMPLEMLREITKAFQEICPGKRVFICFSVAGVAPEVWTINDVQPITPDAGRYITDVAFDMYHPFDGTYDRITREMRERMGDRADLRYWFVPCTMNYRGDKNAEHCIRHLRGCGELLRQMPPDQRGGLMCYTYHTFPADVEDLGNIGLDILLDPNGDMYWPQLGDEIESIGQAIARGDWDA